MPRQKNTMNRLKRTVRKISTSARTIMALRSAYGPVRIYAAKRVAVFPELGLAYNRIKKNANTSTMILLQQLSSGQILKGNVAKDTAHSFFELSAREIKEVSKLHSFVIIRNPYSRVLSAFLGKLKKERYQEKHGTFDLTPMDLVFF